jgi:C4-dicarboxylate-specific signal transduction histidine kinase
MQLSTLRAITKAKDMPLTTIPIIEIINRAASIYKGLLPAKVKLITPEQKGSEAVVTNLDVASFVIIELLRNAAKAMGNEQGEITIEVTSKNTDTNSFAIRISDSGPGLPVERASAPFSPPPNGSPKGWGMYLCYRCAFAIRGRLNLIESSAKGTVFEIALPTEQSLNLK